VEGRGRGGVAGLGAGGARCRCSRRWTAEVGSTKGSAVGQVNQADVADKGAAHGQAVARKQQATAPDWPMVISKWKCSLARLSDGRLSPPFARESDPATQTARGRSGAREDRHLAVGEPCPRDRGVSGSGSCRGGAGPAGLRSWLAGTGLAWPGAPGRWPTQV